MIWNAECPISVEPSPSTNLEPGHVDHARRGCTLVVAADRDQPPDVRLVRAVAGVEPVAHRVRGRARSGRSGPAPPRSPRSRTRRSAATARWRRASPRRCAERAALRGQEQQLVAVAQRLVDGDDAGGVRRRAARTVRTGAVRPRLGQPDRRVAREQAGCECTHGRGHPGGAGGVGDGDRVVGVVAVVRRRLAGSPVPVSAGVGRGCGTPEVVPGQRARGRRRRAPRRRAAAGCTRPRCRRACCRSSAPGSRRARSAPGS